MFAVGGRKALPRELSFAPGEKPASASRHPPESRGGGGRGPGREREGSGGRGHRCRRQKKSNSKTGSKNNNNNNNGIKNKKLLVIRVMI